MHNDKIGICICGLNGSGKTTLGKALSQKINFRHFDTEDFYFDKSNSNPYSASRTRDQVEAMLFKEIQKHPQFIFTAVNGDFGKRISSAYKLVVYLAVPLDERMRRVKQRALDKFGDRVLEGGDMYEQEQKFFNFCAGRSDEKIIKWIETLSCPVLFLDGTKSTDTSIEIILKQLKKMGHN